jgi:hypothetical protein
VECIDTQEQHAYDVRMTTTQIIGRWLIIGGALSTAILSFVAIAYGRDAAAEVASDTGYGIGVALGEAGWPFLALLVALWLLVVVLLRPEPPEVEPDENGDRWHDPKLRPGGRPTGVYVNGVELRQGQPNYVLIAQLEKDLLAPRTPADWVREAEIETAFAARSGLAVASPVESGSGRRDVRRMRRVSGTWRDRDE